MSENCSETGLNCSINPPGTNGLGTGNACTAADEDILQVRCPRPPFFHLKAKGTDLSSPKSKQGALLFSLAKFAASSSFERAINRTYERASWELFPTRL